MTYRNKIQDLIKMIDTIYDDAEVLRDIATEDEKIYWNEIRKIFYSAGAPLSKLDNSLNPNRASLDLSYSFDENAKRIS
jgi:hypothetical protein